MREAQHSKEEGPTMSEPTSPLQRWILESQQALLNRRRTSRPTEAQRPEQNEPVMLLGE